MIAIDKIRNRWSGSSEEEAEAILQRMTRGGVHALVLQAIGDIDALVREVERIEVAARTTIERHQARPCADAGKDCSICELAKVLVPAPKHATTNAGDLER